MNTRQVGTDYEMIACDYLAAQGYRICARNFRTRYGEIDIIAKEGDYTCFVEVKFRTGTNYGFGSEAVDIRKQRSISRVALAYLHRERLSEWDPIRFDLVYITGKPGNGTEITLLRDAFDFCR